MLRDSWLVGVLGGLAFLAGMVVGNMGATHAFQKQAVATGHAEWQVNADGGPVFRWKVPDHE